MAAEDPGGGLPAPLAKLVSGGQAGVDRAALDVALRIGLPCAGWCPRGRRAEDGPIAARYPLRETASADYAERTRLNVRDSDGTLVLNRGVPVGGTRLTMRCTREAGRPLLVLDLAAPRRGAAALARAWIAENRIAALNVAGPRESTVPGIQREAVAFLTHLLAPR